MLDERMQRRIDAYAPGVRARIEPLIRRSRALDDLAESFPALLFALATGFGSDAARIATLDAVETGVSLKEAAARIGLPMWLRKLPASAFVNPIVSPPRDPALAERLVSLIPAQPAAAAAWLERILIAHHCGRPDLALWVAQQFRTAKPVAQGSAFLGVLAWAWYSGRPEEERASALITTRWKPTLG
ncbi:unnamed protein product, partial [Phaeothamnion confervicola]